MANTPVLFTSFVAMAAKLSITFEQTAVLSSCSSASAFTRAPLVIALAPAFIAFMGAIASDKVQRNRKAVLESIALDPAQARNGEH